MLLPSTQDFSIDESNRIFQIPLEEFPGFWGYAYLVMCKDPQLGELSCSHRYRVGAWQFQ